jgi:hypothetical protein
MPSIAFPSPDERLPVRCSSLDTRAAVTAGHAAYQGAIKQRDAAEVDRLAADESLKSWVLARFGAGSAEASEFGFAPRKKAEVSAETRAAAVAQNKATRAARLTISKKEKLKIKGVVPTATAPAAPAVTAASAPSPTLIALPALMTTAASAAGSAAPSAQVAAAPAVALPAVAATPPVATNGGASTTNGAGH